MNRRGRSRTPAIVRIFATALKAWWDDDAYSCQILLLGAEFTRVYAEHRGTTFDPYVFAEQARRTQSGDTGNRLDVIQPNERDHVSAPPLSIDAAVFAVSQHR